MGIYAIADLHLSFSSDKPMDIYGGEWINHTEKIKNNWEAMISEEDTVIIPGDISWALRLNDAMVDLKWISELPGKKILIKGNHDLWWNSVNKLNALYNNMFFLHNAFYEAEGYAICGTRGWTCPDDDDFTLHDEKIYRRELGRLKTSLEAATKAGYQRVDNESSRILGVLHFPPFGAGLHGSGFSELFEKYGVEKVLYGHLHGKEAKEGGVKGIKNGVEYILVSTDYLCNIPQRII